jgi:hypothetical protein
MFVGPSQRPTFSKLSQKNFSAIAVLQWSNWEVSKSSHGPARGCFKLPGISVTEAEARSNTLARTMLNFRVSKPATETTIAFLPRPDCQLTVHERQSDE